MARIEVKEHRPVVQVSKLALFEVLCDAVDILYARVGETSDPEVEAVLYQAMVCGWSPPEDTNYLNERSD